MLHAARTFLRTCGLPMLTAACLAVPSIVLAEPPASAPASDPGARALYDGVIAAMRRAQTLAYESNCRWESDGQEMNPGQAYKAWLKKPNYFRIEGFAQGKLYGTLVGDGHDLWVFWPDCRPSFGPDDTDDEEARRNQYMTKPAPIGGHSIGHEVGPIGAMTILDPSIFHGYTDSLQPYISGVTRVGVEEIGGLECDVIEVSILDGQRTWRIWIGRKDNLPRRIEEVIRVAETMVRYEEWTDVKVNEPIPDKLFAWSPPPGWREWTEPDPELKLLKPGWRAPDFRLLCADGRQRGLSDYKGKVVWLVFWRYG
jgi:outer membrane lipoprotein-sorting protein